MVEVLGTGIESETTQGYEEARSVLGSLITQIIGTVRTIISYALSLMKQFVTWAGNNPLAMVLTVANLVIWTA